MNTKVAQDRESPYQLRDGRFAQRQVTLPTGAQATVRTAGGGSELPVIVLLHGIGSSSASWANVALALKEEARTVAWDAPGYGGSTPLASAAPLALDYVQRLNQLLAELRIGRCVLVGHSLGALIAAAFASAYGHLVQRLILISPAQGYGGPGRSNLRQKVLSDRMGSLAYLGIDGLALLAPARLLSAAADESARAWIQWNALRLNPHGYSQAVQMLCNDDIDRYTKLSMPVDVLCGDADTVTAPVACREIANHFNAGFELISEAGHASPIEQPEQIAHRIASIAGLACAFK